MATKISYRTVTLERALPVPRDQAWGALGEVVGSRVGGVSLGLPVGAVTEVVLSDEAPWRRVARLDGEHPSPLVQTSFTIRDDVESSLLAWSCLIDPTDVDPAALDAMVEVVAADGTAQLDQVVALTAGTA